jgi:hypothetical protein
MTAEFNVWLLLVGLIIGGGLTWLVVGELRRSEADVGRAERELEASWIADQLTGSDHPVDEFQADAVLQLHQRYLATSLPPAVEDDAAEDAEDPAAIPSTPTSATDPIGPETGSGAGTAPAAADRAISPPRTRRGHRPTG